jgi:hypothetical protein
MFGELEGRVDLRMLSIPSPRIYTRDMHLGEIYQRRTLCHVLRLGAWAYPSRRILVKVAKQLLLLGAGRDWRQLILGDWWRARETR